MKKPTVLLLIESFLLMVFPLLASAGSPPPPTVNEVIILTGMVEQYGKFEARIDLTADFTNPYDYDQVAVAATFTSPSGETSTVDGFFMQDYILNQVTGNLTAVGTGEFRVRFAPGAPGAWSLVVSVTDANGTSVSEPAAFQCTEVSSSLNHGFLRTGTSHYLRFDDGEPYIAVGQNMAWQNNNAYLNYQSWLGKLIANGGNFFRLWHAHWGLGIEWEPGGGFEGLRRYHQRNSFYQDWLYDHCAENGVYIMLALQHHGPVSTQVDANWNDSPYNVANGGPCQNTLDFFTNVEALAHTRNRYRYIMARWGYSRAILSWELFNEVNWTDGFESNMTIIANWHYDMATFLKTIDPNNHIVTTSFGSGHDDPNVWVHPDLNLTQGHYYLNNPHLERAIITGTRHFLDNYDKPFLAGEFGLGGSASLANVDPNGIHFHNGLWGALFGGGLGTGMSWWWDSYIHPRDLYYHYSGISEIVADIPFLNKSLTPANDAYPTGAPGDLELTPSLGWSGIGEANITIDEHGVVSPPGAALGQFLYGSQWNTQYRSPPTFQVNYPSSGLFTVTTSGEAGANPKIAIWLDGNLQLEQSAAPYTSYSISVPAGSHAIKVDNTGTDWITIASYFFEGVGSQIDAYVLVSENQDVAAGWALNSNYNHQYIAANGVPEPTPPASVIVEGFQNGTFIVNWYHPLTGAHLGSDQAAAAGGTLEIPLPAFLWDLVFVVENTSVSTRESRRELAFEIYPNPALAGSEVNLRWSGDQALSPYLSLLDMGGRKIADFNCRDGKINLPETLPEGLYWLKAVSRGQTGLRALVVTK